MTNIIYSYCLGEDHLSVVGAVENTAKLVENLFPHSAFIFPIFFCVAFVAVCFLFLFQTLAHMYQGETERESEKEERHLLSHLKCVA